MPRAGRTSFRRSRRSSCTARERGEREPEDACDERAGEIHFQLRCSVLGAAVRRGGSWWESMRGASERDLLGKPDAVVADETLERPLHGFGPVGETETLGAGRSPASGRRSAAVDKAARVFAG